MYNLFIFHPHSRWFFVSQISIAQLAKAMVFIFMNTHTIKTPSKGGVFSAAVSLCCQLASQGAAFTSFKLPLLTLAIPQRDLVYFFLSSLFNASFSAFENGFPYSFTLNLSIAISCLSCSLIYFATVATFNPTVLT